MIERLFFVVVVVVVAVVLFVFFAFQDICSEISRNESKKCI